MERPKQLLPLLGRETLFQATVSRLEPLFPPERILVVTIAGQAREMKEQVPSIPEGNYLIEPAPRGTASVVALAAAVLQKRDPQAVMTIQTADHHIRDRNLFGDLIRAAIEVAENKHLVTLGITPTFPSTGYGYIQQGEPLAGAYTYPVYTVKRFMEKPDEVTAQQLLQTGGHSWNSGMFVWRADVILAEIEKQMPELFDAVRAIASVWDSDRREDVVRQRWSNLKSQTIDYGVMEKAERVAVLPAGGLGWSDVGSWDSLFEVLTPDAEGNVAVNAEYVGIDTHDTLVYGAGSQRLLVTIGLEHMIVVDSGDVLMVCRTDQAQRVREVVERLRKDRQDKYL
jgi:mannose-1-phosphate guanylyltransferase